MRGAGDSRAVQTGKGERRMIRICCITYKDVDRLVREALESYQDNDVEFSIVEGLRTEILEEEKRKVIEGADVAIAAGANAQIAAAAFQIPVLQLRITDFDYLTAVEQGLKLGRAPAVVTYQQPISRSKKKRDMSIHQIELTKEAKEILILYHWPGNIRELQNVCERFCLYLKQSALDGIHSAAMFQEKSEKEVF